MIQEKIETPYMQLAKLLIARKLQDQGLRVDHTKISTSLTSMDDRDPKARFRYPLRKMTINIQSVLAGPEDVTAERILEIAEEQANEYYRVSCNCDGLEELLAEAKAIAKREVVKANRRGMALRFLDVQPSIVSAGDCQLPSPEVSIEMLSTGLLPERCSIVAKFSSDISDNLTEERVVKHQTIRATRKRWLAGYGTGGAIDAIVLTALKSGRHDVPAVIRRMRASNNGFVLECGGRDLNLWWDDGLINVSFQVDDDFSYGCGRLMLDVPVRPHWKLGLVGKPARPIVESALFEGAIIAEAVDSFGNLEATLEPRFHVFDAKTLEPRDQLFPM